MASLLALGPAQLPVRSSPAPLPRDGIAIQTAQSVVLIDPSGRVLQVLKGYRLRDQGVQRSGQVELSDASGRDFELRAGRLVRVERGAVTLANGYVLRLDKQWELLQGGKLVTRFPSGAHLELDSSGTQLTTLAAQSATVRDLRTGSQRRLPDGCRVGARTGGVEYQLCGFPYAKGKPSTIVRVDGTGRRLLSGPAGAAGSWSSVRVGSGGLLLGQWSGKCAAPAVFVVDPRSGHRTGLGDASSRAVTGEALGWLGTTPFAALPRSSCATSPRSPAIYAYDATGRPLLVRRLPTALGVRAVLWDG